MKSVRRGMLLFFVVAVAIGVSPHVTMAEPLMWGQLEFAMTPVAFGLDDHDTVIVTLRFDDGDLVEQMIITAGGHGRAFIRPLPSGTWHMTVESPAFSDGYAFAKDVAIFAETRTVVWLTSYRSVETGRLVDKNVENAADPDMVWPLGVGNSWTYATEFMVSSDLGETWSLNHGGYTNIIVAQEITDDLWTFFRVQDQDDETHDISPILFDPTDQGYRLGDSLLDFERYRAAFHDGHGCALIDTTGDGDAYRYECQDITFRYSDGFFTYTDIVETYVRGVGRQDYRIAWEELGLHMFVNRPLID